MHEQHYAKPAGGGRFYLYDHNRRLVGGTARRAIRVVDDMPVLHHPVRGDFIDGEVWAPPPSPIRVDSDGRVVTGLHRSVAAERADIDWRRHVVPFAPSRPLTESRPIPFLEFLTGPWLLFLILLLAMAIGAALDAPRP